MAGSTRSPFNTCRNIYWTPHHRRRTDSTPNNLVGLRDARIACRVALLLPCSVLYGQAEETLALGLTSCIYSGVEAPLQERTDIICALTLCDI